MKRYLVSGAQGFVGRFVVAELLRNKDCEVLGIGRSAACADRFTHDVSWNGDSIHAPLPNAIASVLLRDNRYRYQSADLLNVDATRRVFADFQPNYVIHLASGLFGDPVQKLFRCNVEGTTNLLDTIHGSPVERVVLGSSGGVYGKAQKLPSSETDPPTPIHMYSVSKLSAELAAQVKASEHKVPLVIARIFNVVGPGQDERHACGRWMQQLVSLAGEMARGTCAKPELEVGLLNATRDMIDVRDVASACVHLCHDSIDGEIYNVATGIETQMRSVMDSCLAAANLSDQVAIRETGHRAIDIPRHFADISKLESTGWTPSRSLSESLRDLYQYYAETVPASVAQVAIRR